MVLESLNAVVVEFNVVKAHGAHQAVGCLETFIVDEIGKFAGLVMIQMLTQGTECMPMNFLKAAAYSSEISLVSATAGHF